MKNSSFVRGSVLILALWSLFILSLMATAVAKVVRPQLDLAGYLMSRCRSYYPARAAVKKALLEIANDQTQDYDALNDAWSNNPEAFKEVGLQDGIFTLGYQPAVGLDSGSAQVIYGLLDEDRLININRASSEVLKNLFEISAGVDEEQARQLADAVIDWRDPDDSALDYGAEDDYYMSQKRRYHCKNSGFEMLEELLLVKGMEQGIFDKVKDRLTVFSAAGVNINTADVVTLRILGMELELAEKILRFCRGPDGLAGSSDDNVFDNVESIADTLHRGADVSAGDLAQIERLFGLGLLAVRSDSFKGEVSASLQNNKYVLRLTFVCTRDGRLVYWREQ